MDRIGGGPGPVHGEFIKSHGNRRLIQREAELGGCRTVDIALALAISGDDGGAQRCITWWAIGDLADKPENSKTVPRPGRRRS